MWKPYNIENTMNIRQFYSAFVRSCPVEYFFQGESHDFWEIVYVIKGSACIAADNNVIELYENQLIFHKPMEFHSIRTNSNKETELFIMSFSVEDDYIDMFSNCVFNLEHSSRLRLFEIMERLKNIVRNPKDIYEPTGSLDMLLKSQPEFKTLKNLTENFLISLSGIGKVNTAFIRNTETMIYANALKVIDDNIYSRLTVEDLARKCNSSVSYLKKIFGKYNGLGIHEYILNNKLSLAKQLLKEGESVTDIAEKLGFSSQNYFSTAFKRELGVSPGQYKSRMF